MQAMARQVEDQSHEESEPWSTSKPLAKLGKVGKAISSKMEGNRAFRKAKSLVLQGMPNFGRVCQSFARCAKNHFVRTDLQRFFSRIVIFHFYSFCNR